MHLRVPLHPAWHNHPRRRQSLLRRTSGPKHRARRGCLSRGASLNLGVGHSPPPSLTQLAERPSPTLGEREKDPDRDRKAAFSPEEAGVASPVRGGVELVAQEDSDRDTELTVVSSLFRTRRPMLYAFLARPTVWPRSRVEELKPVLNIAREPRSKSCPHLADNAVRQRTSRKTKEDPEQHQDCLSPFRARRRLGGNSRMPRISRLQSRQM